MTYAFMNYPESCGHCGYGGPCEDCGGLGSASGNEAFSSNGCMTCGGTGAAPPRFPNCPEEGCGDNHVSTGL